MKRTFFFAIIAILFTACVPTVANPSPLQPATAQPTANPTEIAGLCEAAALGARNWETSIAALESLYQFGQACPDDSTRMSRRLANAYLGYGTQLEASGDEDAAIDAYESALEYAPTMEEAQNRLALLTEDAGTHFGCPIPSMIANSALPEYAPSDGTFATLSSSGFSVDGSPFLIYGANYFPRDTPFEHFLVKDAETIADELALMRESGLNTLRIFLIYETLFTCTEDGIQPKAEQFSRLDALIQTAVAADFRLILVLNHTLDPTQPPVSMPDAVAAQTAFIVARYAGEPALLAWDLRDGGDEDYINSTHTRQEVLAWLADIAVLVRSLDEKHLITAGWRRSAADTAPLVDFVSFQSFGEYETLRQDIANLRASVNKPILLAAVGYSTHQMDETSQRNLLYQTFEEASHNDLLGWIVYMAFDYPRTVTCTPPECPGEAQPINHFGLWNTSYFPKLAVDAVEVVTGVAEP